MVFVHMLHVLEVVYIELVAVETVAGMFSVVLLYHMRFEFYDFFMSKRLFIALESVGLDVLFMNCLHMSSEAALIYEFFLTNCTRFSVHYEQEKGRKNRNAKKDLQNYDKEMERVEVFQSSEFQVKAKSKCKNFIVGQAVI